VLVTQEKNDHIRNLITVGKERGYLLTDEVNGVLAAEEHSTEELDNLFASLETDGIEIYEDASAAKLANTAVELTETTEIEIPHEPAPGEEPDFERKPGLLDKTSDPVHLAYQQRNRDRGRMAGQLRLRIRYRQFRGDWFDYLFASPAEVRGIVANTGWTVSAIVESQGPGYVAILQKS